MYLPASLAVCPSWNYERAFQPLLTLIYGIQRPPVELYSRHPEICIIIIIFLFFSIVWSMFAKGLEFREEERMKYY